MCQNLRQRNLKKMIRFKLLAIAKAVQAFGIHIMRRIPRTAEELLAFQEGFDKVEIA
jgi:hypothetical protein